MIESLQLELAESQIKLTELEKNGDGLLEELKKELWEARSSNARLMEDNESYQLLLSERTLNGDFTKGDFMRGVRPGSKEPNGGLGSLADELGSVDEEGEKAEVNDMRKEAEAKNNEEEEEEEEQDKAKVEAEQRKAEQALEGGEARKLKAEINNLKDQNKALTLYIERIISRVLQHDGFERVFDKHENEIPASVKAPAQNNNNNNSEGGLSKSLQKEKNDPPPQPTFLQRARSVVSGTSTSSRAQSKSRQTSIMPPPSPPPPSAPVVPAPAPRPTSTTANEDPLTAPRIPLGRAPSVRGHRRAQSELVVDPAAATVVGHMYQPRSAGGVNPNLLVPGSRQTVIGGTGYAPGSLTGDRTPTFAQNQYDRSNKRLSGSDSVSSELLPADSISSTTPSPPRTSSGMNNYTGAVTTQNRLRPLRLVQEASEEEEAARRKANRSSWMSWFNRGNSADDSKENRQP